MTTNIRIDRVVLDGLKLSRRERDAIGPAIARELRRLAAEQAGRADTQRREPGSAVDGIAREVAAAVHRASTATRPAATRPAAGLAATGPAARRGRR